MTANQVIFDTDPGLDDAIALFCLAGIQKEVNITGVTTVFGNVSLTDTTNNALKILEYLQLDVPIYKGACQPLISDRLSGEMIHGQFGLGDVEFREITRTVSQEPAAVQMAKQVLKSPGQVKIVTVGPLTNLAIALSLYPEMKGKVKEIVVMGGALGRGNRTPSAEFNVLADPHAAEIVFQSGANITMLGLDVTRKTIPGEEEISRMVTELPNEIGGKLIELLTAYQRITGASKHMPLHDPCAVLYLTNPSIFTFQPMEINVELTGTHTLGRTIGVSEKEASPLTRVGVGIDRKMFFCEFFRVITQVGS